MGRLIGNFIKERREALGISQHDLSDTLGAKSRQTISNIERGVKPLPTKFIVPLSLALDLPAETLIEVMTEEFQQSCLDVVHDELSSRSSTSKAGLRKPALKTR